MKLLKVTPTQMKSLLKLLRALGKTGIVHNYGPTLKVYVLNPSMEYEDQDGRTPIMIAAMLNKHCRLAILLDVYTS